MKKRNLILLTAVYWFAAITLVGLAIITAGDCGIAIDVVDRNHCFQVAESRRIYGLLVAVIGYAFTLLHYVRKRRNGGG